MRLKTLEGVFMFVYFQIVSSIKKVTGFVKGSEQQTLSSLSSEVYSEAVCLSIRRLKSRECFMLSHTFLLIYLVTRQLSTV